ncbi:MAG TPA: hypothetical protein VEK32_21845 [Thermodesulfobacteriota bacterium]|nr:hypothetical protein [Thermodesulfobacteriota bacterium]
MARALRLLAPRAGSRSKRDNLVVNPASGGTPPMEIVQITADATLLDSQFQLHGATAVGTLTSPKKFPRTLESLGGS